MLRFLTPSQVPAEAQQRENEVGPWMPELERGKTRGSFELWDRKPKEEEMVMWVLVIDMHRIRY